MNGQPAMVIIDGICLFCNASARFVIKRDPLGRFRFCHFQSRVGQALLRDHEQDPELMDSLVLIDDAGVHLRSRAALRIAAGLRFPWWLLRVFSWLPSAWLDVLYDAFAARRYAWFGRSDSCLIPDEAFKSRFVVDE